VLIVRAVIAAGLLAGLASCSTVIEGKSHCAVTRKGVVLGRVTLTPGTVTIEKNRHDINIVCHKPGYETAGFYNESDVAAAAFGNVVIGGVVGGGVDLATGSANKYTSEVTVVLPPLKGKTP